MDKQDAPKHGEDDSSKVAEASLDKVRQLLFGQDDRYLAPSVDKQVRHSSTPSKDFNDDNASTSESGVNATFSRSSTGAVLWFIPRAIRVMRFDNSYNGAALYEKAKMIESAGSSMFHYRFNRFFRFDRVTTPFCRFFNRLSQWVCSAFTSTRRAN